MCRTPINMAAVLLAGMLMQPATMAKDGMVADSDGKPLAGATVCLMRSGVELLCETTDERGEYHLPDLRAEQVRVNKAMFFPVVRPITELETKVMLQPAAAFLARLTDADTDDPVSGGKVFVVLPSGAMKGPFPASKAGVRVSTFVPGPARFRAEADGYLPLKGVEVDLPVGVETTVELKLKKAQDGRD